MKFRTLAEELPNGYRPFTTFFTDLDIADHFGKDAVVRTYNEVMSEWRFDYKYMTEFVMCLNLKCWDTYEHNNHDLSELYSKLYYKAYDWCCANFKEDELEYFYKVTD